MSTMFSGLESLLVEQLMRRTLGLQPAVSFVKTMRMPIVVILAVEEQEEACWEDPVSSSRKDFSPLKTKCRIIH